MTGANEDAIWCKGGREEKEEKRGKE